MSTSEELLKKIRRDLELAVTSVKSADEFEVYKRTLKKLHEAGSSEVMNGLQYEAIFMDCYHKLLELQNSRALTTSEIPLLNDLDEFEDYLIGKQ